MDPQEELTEAELAEVRELVLTDPLVTDKPLLRVARWPDGTVAVQTGVVVGPLHAYGDRLLLRRESGQWVVVDRARWGS
jgi:hypothetical protein